MAQQDTWVDLDSQVNSTKPFVSISKDIVALNSLLSQKYNLDKYSRVSLLVSKATQKIGLKFHNNGSKGLSMYGNKGQKCFSAKKLNMHSWVAEVASLPPSQRHFNVAFNKEKRC